MLFQVVPSVLLSMVALITTYMKESDWLLKNFHQSENGLKSYHGEQNRGYHLKEHKKLYWKLVSKVMLHFVWGHLSRNQTVVQAAKKLQSFQKCWKLSYYSQPKRCQHFWSDLRPFLQTNIIRKWVT